MVTIAVVVVLVFAILVTASSFHGVSTKVHTRPVMTMLFGSKVDTSAVPGETIIGSSDNRMDIRHTAEFLTYAMYDNIPRGQRRELLELESKDLRNRYEEKVGGGRLPSALILAKEDQEIVGCVGLDCQVKNKKKDRFRDFNNGDSLVDFLDRSNSEEICVVLANLAVRRDRRGRGLARNLLAFAEEQTKAWGYSDLYLLVDSENTPAQKLYRSSGFKEIFRDPTATCVVYGNNALKTEECINVCFRKSLKSGGADGGGGSAGGIFGGLFGRK
jgi:GNAT superfamily N-acetyltransferase